MVPPPVMTVVVVVDGVAACGAVVGRDSGRFTMTVMLGSGAGELVPGASGSVGLAPFPA